MHSPHRSSPWLFFAIALVLACSMPAGFGATSLLRSSQDFVAVDLSSDTRVRLFPQTSFAETSLNATRRFRFDQSQVVASELFYLLLRFDHTSKELFSLPSIDEIYAQWKYDVFYYSAATI
jgi:hypothetical protein